MIRAAVAVARAGARQMLPIAAVPRRPGDSMARRGDPGSSYARRDDYDDYGMNDRALMPSPGAGGGALMPQLDDRALPALPSEEEERALGIRRPAYIPATEVRKGERPSNMRVVSGVASIMLLCVAMLGVSGFLVQRNVLPGFLQALGVAHPGNASTVNNALPTQFASLKPVVTQATNKTPLVQMNSYQSYVNGPNPQSPVVPQNATSVFLVNRFVYIIGSTNDQTKKNDQLSIKWYFNDVDATASIQKSKSDCCLYTLPADKAGKQDQILFQLAIPVATRGKAEIYYNGQLAYTIVLSGPIDTLLWNCLLSTSKATLRLLRCCAFAC
jgi:hypothetical protein